MKKLRIVLGSNDGKNIILDHMGEAKNFLIYDLFENGQFKFLEKRENTSPETKGHGDVNKLKVAMEIFKDADVVLSRKISPNYIKMRDNTKFQPVLTEIDLALASILELGKIFDRIYGLVEQRRHGKMPKDIPKLEKKQ